MDIFVFCFLTLLCQHCMYYGIALGRVIMIYNNQNKTALPTAPVKSAPNLNNRCSDGRADYVRAWDGASEHPGDSTIGKGVLSYLVYIFISVFLSLLAPRISCFYRGVQ